MAVRSVGVLGAGVGFLGQWEVRRYRATTGKRNVLMPGTSPFTPPPHHSHNTHLLWEAEEGSLVRQQRIRRVALALGRAVE